MTNDVVNSSAEIKITHRIYRRRQVHSRCIVYIESRIIMVAIYKWVSSVTYINRCNISKS